MTQIERCPYGRVLIEDEYSASGYSMGLFPSHLLFLRIKSYAKAPVFSQLRYLLSAAEL